MRYLPLISPEGDRKLKTGNGKTRVLFWIFAVPLLMI